MRRQTLIITCLVSFAAGCNDKESRNAAKPEARVVFRSVDGRELTLADLAGAEGTFEYEIRDAVQIPAEAESLHQKARRLGASGDYDAAINALIDAQSLAPQWPYPFYDMAFTSLLKKDFAQAREDYRRTVDLAPRGFFTAITACDALDREAKGELPEGTYAAFVALEWLSDSAEKRRVISQLTVKLPTFAPVWKEHALLCDGIADKRAAIEKGLAANPDRETKGILLINKALALNEQGDVEIAKTILGNLALDPNTTFANEHLAKQTLAFIVKR
ncbi:MAG: hypothetical protein JWN70_915 [Planctomycetaceae bacterium]|nr:hypothetical protein [Planctomycetaceae bacterium]